MKLNRVSSDTYPFIGILQRQQSKYYTGNNLAFNRINANSERC